MLPEQKRKRNGLYSFLRIVAAVYLFLFMRIRYEGKENIPTDKGYILCSNHRSLFDPVLVGYGIPQELFFMAKEELFRNKLLAAFFRKMGAFPVKRGSSDTHALVLAADVIRGGRVMAIFPEGTRSRTGVPLPFHAGVGVVAAMTGADVLPVAISFKGRTSLFHRVTVRYGKLMTREELGLGEGYERRDVRNAVRLMNDRVLELVDYRLTGLPEPEAKDAAPEVPK